MPAETVLITGASSGIGEALARIFAADKSNLVLVARSKQKLARLAEEIHGAEGVEVRVAAHDLAEPGAAGAIFEELAGEGVNIDVLVNNAGFGAAGTVASLPVPRQLDMIQVNVASLAHLTRLFLPGMLARNRGGILNVASIAAFQPGPNLAVYCASKAFVLSFSEALMEELAATAVRVTCLCPGPTATGFAAEAAMEHTLLFRMGMMDARTVAVAGHRAFRRGQAVAVPGIGNKLLAFSVRLAPRLVVRKVANFLSR
jgi:short-subunit dehydrogenase